jgi:hypothetical protein
MNGIKRKHTEVIDLFNEDVTISPLKRKKSHEEEIEEMLEGDDGNVDDGENEEELEEIDKTIRDLDPFMCKAIQRIHADANVNSSKTVVAEMVMNYCFENPKQKSIPKIVSEVKKMLKENPNGFVVVKDKKSNDEIVISDDSQPQEVDDVVDIIENGNEIRRIPRPIDQIFNIFPNAKRTYLENLLKEHDQDTVRVIELISEKGYEKEENLSMKKKKIEEKYDFKASSWETSDEYREDTLIELQNNFPFIPVASFPKILAENKHHYYHSIKFIEEATGRKAIFDYYERFHTPVTLDLASNDSPPIQTHGKNVMKYSKIEIDAINLKLKAKSLQSLIKTRQSVRSLPCPSNHINEILSVEIEFLLKEKNNALLDSDYEVAAKLNQEQAAEDGALFECQCCFDNEFSFENIIQCTEGDLFCGECLQRYIQEMIYGGSKIKQPLPCICSANKCPGFFTERMIEKSLSQKPKLLAQYNDTILNDNLLKSQLSLIHCFHCQLPYEISDNSGNVLYCPSCHGNTCLLCKEESHIPLKCSEVEKKSATEKRLKMEEAMALARIRECPTCKKRFYKTEGCNKMTCTCGTIICYICRANINKEKYAHFCQTPHCTHQSCKKCLLYSNTIDDDRRAMLEAGMKVMEEGKEEGEEGKEGGRDIIDVEKTNGKNGKKDGKNNDGNNETTKVIYLFCILSVNIL